MADTGSTSARMAEEAMPLERKITSRKRLILLLLGPLSVLTGILYFYFSGGQYVSTDNAYVRAAKVEISADIPGRIDAIFVRENQPVKKGDLLLALDDEPLRIALSQARAHLSDIRNSVIALKASYRQREEELKAAESTYTMTGNEYQRRQKLLSGKIISTTEFEEARNSFEVAAARRAMIQQEISQVLSELGGDPGIAPEDHARYLEAKARLAQAELDMRHSRLYAPRDGVISQVDELAAGNYVNTGQPLFALIDQDHPWIEVNLKETDLTHVMPGQKARIEIDTYEGAVFLGEVQSIGAGTGSEFSILPAQNATGNWVKVVQRIPVRIRLDGNDAGHVLRAGMSAVATIDTGQRRTVADLFQTLLSWFGI